MSAAQQPIYGPNPWQQAHWDWRAAGNFMAGGAGGGLIIFAVLSGASGLPGTLLLLAGLGLVGLGLLCVWLEIGRPLRAMNVMFNPRTSWMSRESLAATLLFGLGLSTVAGAHSFVALVALTALAFVYCQGCLLQAAKGIPAWREPLLVPLIIATALAEGAGLFWLATAWLAPVSQVLAALFGVLLLLRGLLWFVWRQRIGSTASPRALAVLDRSGLNLQWLGGALPLALTVLAGSGLADESVGALLMAVAGLLTAATGAFFKFTLVTRAGFNQGFSLTRLPVRGVPR